MKLEHQIIDRTIEILTPPQSWIKRALAKTALKGVIVDPSDKDATCWCLLGALDKAGNEKGLTAYDVTMTNITEAIRTAIHDSTDKKLPIDEYNDDYVMSKSEILHTLTHAKEFI